METVGLGGVPGLAVIILGGGAHRHTTTSNLLRCEQTAHVDKGHLLQLALEIGKVVQIQPEGAAPHRVLRLPDIALQQRPGHGAEGQGVDQLRGLSLAGKEIPVAGIGVLGVPVDEECGPAEGKVLMKLFFIGADQLGVRGEHGDVAGAAGGHGGRVLHAAPRHHDDGVAVQVAPEPGIVIDRGLPRGVHGQPKLQGLRIAVDIIQRRHDLEKSSHINGFQAVSKRFYLKCSGAELLLG